MDLLRDFLRQLQRRLQRRGQTPQQAEDLVQEAVLRLYQYEKQGGQVRNARAFLTRTSLNLAVDAKRHERSDRYEAESVEALDLVDLAPTPDEVLLAEQRLRIMKDTLDKTSRRTREIFFMHRLQGLSHAEIAALFHISVSAVEKHIASAVTILAIERQRE